MRLLLTALKIIAISVPLTWLWMEWGRAAYGRIFAQLALPIYNLFGLTTLAPEGARDRFINYLPFLILMLITPRMTWQRRAGGTAIGFVVIFLVHVVFVWIASTAVNPDNTIDVQGFKRIVGANQLSDSIPFVLWVVIAREFVWESAARLFSTAQAGAGPTSEN